MVKIGLKSSWQLLYEYVKITLASAMEYRFNFITQVLTMIINDGIWVVFWWIFFNKFSQINEWSFKELLMLYAVLTFSYGLAGFFFGNRNRLAQVISSGKLDFYLTLPKNELFHVLISKSTWYDVGDIMFGLILATITLSWQQWPLFLIFSLISTTLLVSFGVTVGSLAFFFGNAEESSRQMFMGFVSISSYPVTIFSGFAKVLLLTVIPAACVASIPVELLQNFDWHWFLLLILITTIFLCLAILIFKIGLKRYESGNNINVRL